MSFLKPETSERLNALRATAVEGAGNVCIQWVIDTGDCLMCTIHPRRGHDLECPLRAYFLALDEARGRKAEGL